MIEKFLSFATATFKLFFHYLGFHIETNDSRIADWKWLTENIEKDLFMKSRVVVLGRLTGITEKCF